MVFSPHPWENLQLGALKVSFMVVAMAAAGAVVVPDPGDELIAGAIQPFPSGQYHCLKALL